MSPLHAIRFAILGGVLLFGGASWLLHRNPDWVPTSDANLRALERFGIGFWALAIVGTGALYLKARGITNGAAFAKYSIIGWALAELVAIYGGVIYFLAGDPGWYLLGLAFLALALTIFPAPRRS